MLHEEGAGGERHGERPSAGVLPSYLPMRPTRREALSLWNKCKTSAVARRSQRCQTAFLASGGHRRATAAFLAREDGKTHGSVTYRR
jgi:hypothetical protein